MARIVRGADTARLDLVPQCAGLLAVSFGLSRLFADDHEQLRHGFLVYDALLAWLEQAPDETHLWNPQGGAPRRSPDAALTTTAHIEGDRGQSPERLRCQNRDAVSVTSAPVHAFRKRASMARASVAFPCACSAFARPNSDQPFSGKFFRSSR
jgi:hypothetical protein